MLIAGKEQLTAKAPIAWNNVIDGLQNIGTKTISFFGDNIEKVSNYFDNQIDNYKK